MENWKSKTLKKVRIEVVRGNWNIPEPEAMSETKLRWKEWNDSESRYLLKIEK